MTIGTPATYNMIEKTLDYEGKRNILSGTDIEVGSVLEGTITGITHFGAFVQLSNGKTGLVHISEVADAYVKDIKDFLKESDPVKVKVLSYDGKQKIGLSIRQAQPKPAHVPSSPRPSSGSRNFGPRNGRATGVTFEDKLAKFLKDSDERLIDLHRNTDSKRGGRGSRR